MRRRGERGAIIPLVAISLALLIAITAFAVDIGRQRVARRDMQAVADVIALDMVRQLDGRTQAVIKATSTWRGGLSQSLRNNLNMPGSPAISTQQQQADAVATVAGSPLTVKVTMGLVDPVTGIFTSPIPFPDVPNAVRVIASTSVDFGFAPGSGGASRTSIATSASTACFRLGSYGLRINSSNSVLLKGLVESALGGSVNVSALSYQGLATANISLLSLAAAMGVGTVDQLVALNNVSVANFYLAAATVLQQNGDAANATILNSIATHLGPLPPINVGKLIAATSGGGAAESATINVLDLVTGSAFVANGAALSIPNLAVNLGLTGTNLQAAVSLIQSPQLACGKVDVAKASTSQANLSITGTVASVPALPTSLLGLTASASVGATKIHVDLAKATGTLKAIVCGAATAASPEGVDVLVGSQLGVVSSLDTTVSISGSLTGSGVLGGLLGGLLGSILKVTVTGSVRLTASTSQPAETRTATIRIPNSPTSYSIPVSTGSGSLGLETATVTAIPTLTLTASGLLGLPINLSLNQIASLTSGIDAGLVSTVATPLVNSISSALVTPLAALLGVELAGADVFGVPRPQCSTPSLVG